MSDETDLSEPSEAPGLLLRTYTTEQGLMAAAADEELVGTVHEEGGVRLDVSEEFYGGEQVEAEALADALSEASIANLVGERAVDAGVDAGEIDPSMVLDVDGVPHAQMVRM